MTTEVFAGLIGVICELYLDDLIIFGNSEEEYLERLDIIFKRCEEFNITLHPDKCEFGLSEVEYCGHLVNEHGTHFSRSKLDSILDFPEPNTQKQLKSFLGLANWFRDHVRDFSTKAQPLNAMIKKYNKNRPLVWTDVGRNAFNTLKQEIHNCPLLYFLDDSSPIYLHTDASKYGIGAYLFQVIDGKEKPIGFISKTFDSRMMNWDTPQKEGFAIFYALNKFDYLLRDREFILRTDHENLKNLKTGYASNQKVQRWLTCFQHYMMKIEFIPGSENIVADGLSRLCNSTATDDPSLETLATDWLNALLETPKRESEIANAHNDLAGHGGIQRTVSRLQKAGLSWPNMSQEVAKFIKTCTTCQKMNQAKNKNDARHFTVNSYSPMENISIDFIQGLMPDDEGHDCILVVIDTFTRFVELYPLKGMTAENTAISLLDHAGRYGFPKGITHDGSQSFLAKVIEGLQAWAGTTTKLTHPYSHEENSIVERANKEVMRHLRNIIFDRRVLTTWSRYSPIVQRILNSSVHATTKFTPAQLLFNNNVDLDRGFSHGRKEGINEDISYTQWVEELAQANLTILEVARENLREHDEIHLNTTPTSPTEYPVGAYVLVNYRGNELRRGPPSKLLPFLKGPLRVTSKEGSIYLLQDLVTEKIFPYHIKDIFPFTFDPETVDPREVAVRDLDMYTVSKITDIKGNPKKGKSGLTFQVYWTGFEEPTWEPWNAVRRLTALHDFLRGHSNKNVRSLIPKNFVHPSANP